VGAAGPIGRRLHRRPGDVEHDGAPLADRSGRGASRSRSALRPARDHPVASRDGRGGDLCRRERRCDHGTRPRRSSSQLALGAPPARARGASRRLRRRRRRLARRRSSRMIVAAAGNARILWYLTRGLGVGALLLLTASVALGVLTASRWRSPRWPRFATAGLHRNLTLL